MGWSRLEFQSLDILMALHIPGLFFTSADGPASFLGTQVSSFHHKGPQPLRDSESLPGHCRLCPEMTHAFLLVSLTEANPVATGSLSEWGRAGKGRQRVRHPRLPGF